MLSSSPVESEEYKWTYALISQLLKSCVYNRDDQSVFISSSAVQIYERSYIRLYSSLTITFSWQSKAPVSQVRIPFGLKFSSDFNFTTA